MCQLLELLLNCSYTVFVQIKALLLNKSRYGDLYHMFPIYTYIPCSLPRLRTIRLLSVSEYFCCFSTFKINPFINQTITLCITFLFEANKHQKMFRKIWKGIALAHCDLFSQERKIEYTVYITLTHVWRTFFKCTIWNIIYGYILLKICFSPSLFQPEVIFLI